MTPKDINNSNSAFYFTRWMAVVPLAVMIIPTIILVFFGVIATDVMISAGVLGLMVGSMFSRRKEEYWDIVIDSLGDKTGLMAFALFLIVGVYAELLTESNLGSGVIWLSNTLHAGPAVFTIFVYIISSVLGTAMGTSVGVIFILTPILYPVALSLGVPPGLAAGAILSGAATGDHFSPVSDTTLISSMTQRYKYKDGAAQVGDVVRARMKYVIPAFVISCIFYFIAGILSDSTEINAMEINKMELAPLGLTMILPMGIVILSAVRGASVFQAITYGIISGLILAPSVGLITLQQIFSIQDGKVTGILVDGALSNIDTVMMIVLMMGAYGVMRHYGLIDIMISKLTGSLTTSPRNTELTIIGLTTLLSFILIGLVTRLTVIAGPVINEIGQKDDLHPCRRANLLDGVANGLSYVIPWHVWPMLMMITITPLKESYDYLVVPEATSLVLMTFYPMIIWVVMLLSVIFGYGRRFEKDKV